MSEEAIDLDQLDCVTPPAGLSWAIVVLTISRRSGPFPNKPEIADTRR
jgi:hypothetical protein